MEQLEDFGAADVVEAAVESGERVLHGLVEQEVDVGGDVLLAVVFGDGNLRAAGYELDGDGLVEALAGDFEVEAEGGLEVVAVVFEEGLEAPRHRWRQLVHVLERGLSYGFRNLS